MKVKDGGRLASSFNDGFVLEVLFGLLLVGIARVILPVLTGCRSRIQAAIFSFWAGVMPPMPMLGRSLL